MKCIANNCNRQATPVVKFGKVVSYICEHCGQTFSIRNNGQASKKEIEELQNEQFRQIMKTGTYTPIRKYITGLKQNNTKMLDPMHEREETFTRDCHLRARG